MVYLVYARNKKKCKQNQSVSRLYIATARRRAAHFTYLRDLKITLWKHFCTMLVLESFLHYKVTNGNITTLGRLLMEALLKVM